MTVLFRPFVLGTRHYPTAFARICSWPWAAPCHGTDHRQHQRNGTDSSGSCRGGREGSRQEPSLGVERTTQHEFLG